MYKFDSEKMIKELEEIYGVDDIPISYEEFEEFMEEYCEEMNEISYISVFLWFSFGFAFG